MNLLRVYIYNSHPGNIGIADRLLNQLRTGNIFLEQNNSNTTDINLHLIAAFIYLFDAFFYDILVGSM